MNRKYENIREVMEGVMCQVLPIPKTPRVYHAPPPPKPISWVPHGTVGNEAYETRLKLFANEVKAIDAQRTRHLKLSSRGWAYALEGLGKITKNEFNACQKAINDCRKLGLLPIDFTKEDQDETRRFEGIIQASNPTVQLEQIRDATDDLLRTLAESATDFWQNEKFYLMMCVEKGDIKDLFKPVCRKYHVPIVSSKGWAPILLRAHIAELSRRAEQRKLTPVLLLFYDHDPAGLKITRKFRKNLKDCEKGIGWNPRFLIIERFGLNAEDIEKYNLTWIDNLKTSSGREARAPEYIQKFGKRKCESNALFKNDSTLEDAKERFKQKEKKTKQSLSEIYDNPIWQDFRENLERLIESFSEKEVRKAQAETEFKQETELDAFVDNKYYGRCPSCGWQFNYSEDDVGKLVRCRYCDAPMRLKWKGDAQP
jgi:hypothetical protein